MSLNKEESNYLNLLENILNNGVERSDRTGIGTKSIFGTQLRFSLKDNQIPLLTTKRMFFRGIVEELLFFCRGDTDTKKLEAKGVNIWKGNTSREFLDKRGLHNLPEGDMGSGYGALWRNFGDTENCDNGHCKARFGEDQLANLLKSLKSDPYSRRHIITAWNPQQLDECTLPPCHMIFQFYVNNNELSCMFNMRSVDVFLGLPFNIASYAVLTHMIAKATGLEASELIFTGGDTHIYLSHLEATKEQLKRTPYEFPKLHISKSISSIKDIEELCFEDFELENYKHYPAIKTEMAV